jgi:glutaminyl-tRNA synthetase
MTYTVMSKRLLLQLVQENLVNGWDDPRMPTISGLRRRGYTPASLRNFADLIGVAKRENVIDFGLLEFCVREDLNKTAPRIMAVLNPLKVVITNYPEGKVEEIEAENNPEDPAAGSRLVPFSREIFIEQEDFLENPPPKFFRLAPGTEVRLKNAYIIKCEEVIKDASGNITELHCTYDPETRSGSGSQRKVKGTLHWVSIARALPVEVRLYDRLFMDPDPSGHKDRDFKEFLNPDSLKVIYPAYAEPSVKDRKPYSYLQFQRIGYFNVDPDSTTERMVFNRTVALKDPWAKLVKSEK